MNLRLLARCTHERLLNLWIVRILQCLLSWSTVRLQLWSGESCISTNCPTSTVVRNPALVQNLFNLSCCDNFSIRSLHLCNRNSFCAGSSFKSMFCLDHAWHERWTRLSSHNGSSRSIVLVGTIENRQFSTTFAFELTPGQWTRGSEDWLSSFCECHQHFLRKFLSHSPCGLSSRPDRIQFFLIQARGMTIALLRIFLQREKRVDHLTRILLCCLLLTMRCRLKIDMKIFPPVTFSGVSFNLNSNSLTSWLSCNVLNPGKIFHSNFIGSPSILSKNLYSGGPFEPRQSVFPCHIWLRVLVHLSKTKYRIWEYVDTCALETDDMFIINQRQILPHRIFPINCVHSRDLIWLSISQICRTSVSLWDLLYFWWNANCLCFSSPRIQMLPMSKTQTFPNYKNVCRSLLLHLLSIVFASFALDHSPCARMIWILTTILILLRCKEFVSTFSINELVRSLWANNGSSPFYRPSIHQIFHSWEDQALSSSHPE